MCDTALGQEFSKIKQLVRADWSRLDGEARRDAEQLVSGLEARLAKVSPAAKELKGAVIAIVKGAAPGVLSAVQSAFLEFLAQVVPELAEDGAPE